MRIAKAVTTGIVCTMALLSWAYLSVADPRPLLLGEEYFPPESRRLGEGGVCVVKFTVRADGAIEAPMLTKSTGYSRLDDACVAGFMGQRMKPSIRDGKPTTITVEVPVVWKLDILEQARIRINPDDPPRIGKNYYPAESMRLREESVCVVKVEVLARGDVRVSGLTHSTGFSRFDQACLHAYNDGEPLPATANGVAVDSTAELPVAWRLGAHNISARQSQAWTSFGPSQLRASHGVSMRLRISHVFEQIPIGLNVPNAAENHRHKK